MKPASIYNLLHVLAEIAEAEQTDSERVQEEIEKAPTIEALAEALASINKPKECRRDESNGIRVSNTSLSFPSATNDIYTFVLAQIAVVRSSPTAIHLYVGDRVFSFGEGYIQLAPSVFKRLTEYFTD